MRDLWNWWRWRKRINKTPELRTAWKALCLHGVTQMLRGKSWWIEDMELAPSEAVVNELVERKRILMELSSPNEVAHNHLAEVLHSLQGKGVICTVQIRAFERAASRLRGPAYEVFVDVMNRTVVDCIVGYWEGF